MAKFKRFLELFMESNQSITDMGYPLVIASLLNEKLGKYAHTVAKWYREAQFSVRDDESFATNWWLQVSGRKSFGGGANLWDMTYMYDATKNIEDYHRARERLEWSPDDEMTEHDLAEYRTDLKNQIREEFFGNWFFTQTLIEDIVKGKLKDIAPYRDMKFWEALHKYDAKSIFQDKQPLKVYKNGFKWIDVGKRCSVVGDLMKNCGSAGVMSADQDRTMIALFDPNNKPHAVVTYSPNQKRISGDEGVASTPLKPIYHRYVLDLEKLLGATFDYQKSKSDLLRLKSTLQGTATNLRQYTSGPFNDKMFRFVVGNEKYVSDGYVAVPTEDLQKVKLAINQNQLQLRYKGSDLPKTVLNYQNQDQLKNFGIRYLPLSSFSQTNTPIPQET